MTSGSCGLNTGAGVVMRVGGVGSALPDPPRGATGEGLASKVRGSGSSGGIGGKAFLGTT